MEMYCCDDQCIVNDLKKKHIKSNKAEIKSDQLKQ